MKHKKLIVFRELKLLQINPCLHGKFCIFIIIIINLLKTIERLVTQVKVLLKSVSDNIIRVHPSSDMAFFTTT